MPWPIQWRLPLPPLHLIDSIEAETRALAREEPPGPLAAMWLQEVGMCLALAVPGYVSSCVWFLGDAGGALEDVVVGVAKIASRTGTAHGVTPGSATLGSSQTERAEGPSHWGLSGQRRFV